MSVITEARLNDMCNLSEVILEKGIEEGRAKEIIDSGYEFGLSEIEILERLQVKMNISEQEARRYLDKFKEVE